MVLQDAGVSRRHVRIAERLGRYFVRDLDSAHGTRLNTRKLSGEQELRDGDRLLVGDAECLFALVARRPVPAFDDAEADADGDDAETMTSLRPDLARPVKSDRAETIEALPALPSPPPCAPEPPTTLVEMPAAQLPAFAAPTGPVPGQGFDAPTTLVEMPAARLPMPAAKEGARPSAAERARRQRQHGATLGGQWVLWWMDLPRGRQRMLGGMALGVVVGLVGALVAVFWPAREVQARGEEPGTLSSRVLPDSFGLGQGVRWERPDQKSFDFEFASPSRAVALLRYHSFDISREEVALIVNGTNVGWVPPDTLNTEEREVQHVLLPAVLKRSGMNHLVFDHVRNPPGRETWQVWNVRLEIIPVPELPAEQLMDSARTLVKRARDFYDRRTVGPANLFLSWENYRSAWITLEALEQKPDLYEDVRHMLAQVSTDLDQVCGQLMLDFQRHIQLGKTKRAAMVLEEINRRFPTEAHRCHNLAAEKAIELGQ